MDGTDEIASDKREILELADESKRLLKRLRRSIRSSIATSRRRTDWDPHDLGGVVADFGETLEWRNENVDWDLGLLRVRARGLLQTELATCNEPYLVFAHALLTVAEHVNSQSATAWRRTIRSEKKLDVVGELHSQAISVTEEVLALIAAGYPTGASARWRTLYELAITAEFIARSPTDTAQRYSASHILELRNQNEIALEETPSRDGRTRKMLLRKREDLQSELDRLLAKYGPEFMKPYGWAAKRLGTKKVTFADIERRVRSRGTRILPHGDRFSYKEASQHIHGERLSSIKTLAFRLGTESVLLGATLRSEIVQAATVWTLQHLTWTLAELTTRTQQVPEALYWAYVGHMTTLDADTEVWHRAHTINTGYLRERFALP